jgi:exopolyphosphatase/guanosine-5'-triphosphate,3'-diphosphate pyrophosphatase
MLVTPRRCRARTIATPARRRDDRAVVIGSTDIARWEWRSFGPQFGPAGQQLSSLAPDRVEESDETYVLAAGCDASVKVRAGGIDVKHLLQVDEDGLEQWMPVLKARFPLSRDDARLVLETLGAPGPPPDGVVDTLDDLVGMSAGAVAFDVHKHRAHYTIGGCMAELTEIRGESGAVRTMAIEANDAARVRAAVSELGLSGRRVECMARGLKALEGITTTDATA